MKLSTNKLELLKWDSNFFGYCVGRVYLSNITIANFQKIRQSAERKNVRVIYLIISQNDILSTKHAEQAGAELYDEKITYCKNLLSSYSKNDEITSFGAYQSAKPLYHLALQSGIYSRFYLDKRFTQQEYARLYTTWIANSVNRTIAKDVLVYKNEDEYFGLITLGIKNERTDIGLLAVDEKTRGKNIGTKLINAATYISNTWGYNAIQVVTQGANKTACHFYEKCGFYKENLQYIYHFWI